ncbi:unnamed protein product [Sympodiomycopsis kandeliae]
MVHLKTILPAVLASAVVAQALPYSDLNLDGLSGAGLTRRAVNDSLPNVQIFATGGTISGGSPDPTDVTAYKAGRFTIEQIVDDIPALKNVSNVHAFQYANVDSGAINTTFALSLSKNIQDALQSNNSLSGAVVTHGTDTLEETAFLLELTVDSPKPVVVVGSMRPKSSISFDGDFNLLQGVSLAGHKSAKNRGTLVVLNDRIASAYYATKTNARTLDTFKAIEAGYLGTFQSTEPIFWYGAAKPGYLTQNPKFDISNLTSLPKVAILYAYQEMDIALLNAAVDAGAKGIVIAGSGNGGISPLWADRMTEIIAQGIPIVASTRTGSGSVENDGEEGTVIASGSLNPQKAKVLLQLILGTAKEDNKVETARKAFDIA